MGFNFPNTPNPGDTSNGYTWDGQEVDDGAEDINSGGDSFIQAGAGAVTRTMQDKARDVFSVKDFGAIGDGNANDGNAINAAILAAINAGGGRILVPKGLTKPTACD